MPGEYPTYRLLVGCWLKIKAQIDRRLPRLRHEYWRQQVGGMGRGVKFYGRVVIEHPERLFIGDHSTFNEGVIIFARAPVRIGSYVRVGTQVTIMTGAVTVDGKWGFYEHHATPVTIEDGVVIYSGVRINPGVTIGRHSVVAAGAVVVHDVPPDTLVAGVPARVVRRLAPEPLQES